MSRQLLNIKKKLLMNFDKIKKEKTKLKIIKYINLDLIHFEQHTIYTQEHNHIFKYLNI